jgi:hypothetical protein
MGLGVGQGQPGKFCICHSFFFFSSLSPYVNCRVKVFPVLLPEDKYLYVLRFRAFTPSTRVLAALTNPLLRPAPRTHT